LLIACLRDGGGRRYPVDDGIPKLFAPVDAAISDHDVTETVKAFYEETPFPNYDDYRIPRKLDRKAQQGLFAAALDEQLPDGAIVLEAGCGTGQPTNFLGLSWRRRVIGGDVWVQPAAGDAGGSLGAALAAYHLELDQPRHLSNELDGMSGSYLGPAFADGEIRQRLTAAGAVFAELGDDEVIERTASALAAESAVGWFQGRMEFGPRALGARSILADARSPSMQRTLNLKVKHRESFGPFAP
jgi:predicted NodU family carbamoyl transferase